MPSRFSFSASNSTLLWNIVFGFTLLVYAVGLFVPIMEPDAAVYAQVSMEMYERGDYLSIYHKGTDWLDKPHFPFWMSALSYEIFGVNTPAYKLPAILFILLAALYTYLFCKKFYSALHGRISAIILITAEHIIISNQDVRAEPFMTGLMIMGLYHFACLIAIAGEGRNPQKKSGLPAKSSVNSTHWFHTILASLAVACLIMTKGLFTIIPIAAGIGLSLLYAKKWKDIFNWNWPVMGLLVVIFLTPALYGYFQQFDKHPEKIIFGQNNVSGVEFFLWTSQWGRFTNTGPIKGSGDITFFIHTLLWAFLPWAFIAFLALYHKTKQLIKRITIGENYTYFGFITLFLIFSASRFQLSFYLNPLFPFLAILTTAIILNRSVKVLRTISIIHIVLCSLLLIGLILLHFMFSGGIPHTDTLVILVSGVSLGYYLFTRKGMYLKKSIFATALVVLSVNYYLNREFYPELLRYQAESEVAYYIKKNGIVPGEVIFAGQMQSVGDVILEQPTKVIPIDSISMNQIAGKYVFTSPEGRQKIESLGFSYVIVNEFPDFHVTRLTGNFINRQTRSSELEIKYLLKINRPEFSKPVVEVAIH